MSSNEADAFEYEPRPNMVEQRELRKEYRALLASAQNTRRHLPESSIADVGDMVRLGDELYSKDSLLDSRFLLSMSGMGAEMTRTRRVGADAFDLDEYMHRVAQFIGGHASSARRGLREVDDFNAADTELWDWKKLGNVAAQYSHRAPIPDFLLGPLQVELKHRKNMRHSRLNPESELVAPQQLSSSDIEQSENETSRMVMEIASKLEECSGDQGVCLFRFAFDPKSFSNTVENLFYVSFLIRDGRAAILEDENGEPKLMSSYEPTEEDRNAGLTRRQIVMELDEELWRNACQVYNIEQSIVPSRSQTAVASSSRWYG
ncbi:hypothetical protein MYAM1_001459 [Malassezia yamatoensis]|uniref:Non-structural maintenance of chromosomes element 4 n=1 Tax=Malassezia yamatoensis TaxID=253288 RepID=A0AAJ6CFX4_9BASI|nr:hypothetical protein MYAM1_001459 [Malassezia yamatoensis]